MKKYRMTDEEYAELIEACKPVPYLVFNGIPPESPEEKAMRVWVKIANRVGCIGSTIGPDNTGDQKDFIATPKDNNP